MLHTDHLEADRGMKRRLRKRWPRLSRRGKILRNTALAAGLLLLFWLGVEQSAWTTDGALRRMEAGRLLEPGETLYRQKGGETGGEEWVFVLGDTYAYTGVVRNRDLGRSFYGRNAAIYESLPLDQAPGLLSLSGWDILGGKRETWRAFCPNGPEDAETARLTIQVSCTWRWENGKEELQNLRLESQAKRDEHGVFSFLIRAETEEEKMVLCALMGGTGYETGEDDHTVRRGEITVTDCCLEFAADDGTTIERVQGIPIGEDQET